MIIKRYYFWGFDSLIAILVIPLLTACGQGGGESSKTPTLATTANSVPLVVDAGPLIISSSFNVGYVTVSVCPPGSKGLTSICQTIDHVSLDTGSSGLRLLNSTIANMNLPIAADANGHAIGECLRFVVGTIWGSVRYADIYIAGEVAKNVPIQDIGDTPGGVTAIPSDCLGTPQNTLALLGSNGVLGVSNFVNDCDACLGLAVPGFYYTCAASTCVNSTVTATQVVRNPVASFSQDNNGVLIKLPVVGNKGSTGVTGSLIFGIGTQANNALGSASIYAIDPSTGDFTTNYKGANIVSYLDSGSNGFFFNDASISICSTNTWAFCPTVSPMTLSAQNVPFNGAAGPLFNFNLVDADTLFNTNNVVAGNVGGPSGLVNPKLVWGLPFFYGKSVFTAISGANTPSGPGPYWAY